MLPTSRYTSFFSTHSFYEGVRITIGMMVPVLVAARYDEIGWGLAMALGALCVSLTDNAGPLHHRINGMWTALGFMLVTSLITGFALPYTWLLMFLLGGFAFFFSVIGVFGNRAASIGTSVLVAITLQLTESPLGIWGNALLTAAGGVWYFLLSMALYRIRPYKLAQQVLGDCITETARFLELKAGFYFPDADNVRLYDDLLKVQAEVHNKQELAREVLFKTRSIVKETTHTGRVLVMAFLDAIDLFETILTSEQDHQKLQEHLSHTGILPHFGELLKALSAYLKETGVAIQEGKSMPQREDLRLGLAGLEDTYAASRHAYMNGDNAEYYASLRQILGGISDLLSKIDRLTMYTSYDRKLKNTRKVDYERFVVPSYINGRLLLDNLSFQSNIFRYSLRMAVAIMVGYALSLYLPVGHSYWILLTIVVILKPAYALTRQRNNERLLGTVAGGMAGVGVLFATQNTLLLLAILIICMTGAFSLMRIRYWLSVGLLTLYVLVALYLLKPGDYTPIFTDRLLDTFIGSLIAISFSRIIPPIWERDQLKQLLVKAIETNREYFAYMAEAFWGKPINISQYKWYRKETYVALANLSEAFQRMLNEPKSRQQSGEFLHPMVVSCHVLASRIATLSGYSRGSKVFYEKESLNQVIQTGIFYLETAIGRVLHNEPGPQNKVVADMNGVEKWKVKVGSPAKLIPVNRDGDGGAEQDAKVVAEQLNAIITIASEISNLAGKVALKTD
jgi:uncharacterized membrane protein YccC